MSPRPFRIDEEAGASMRSHALRAYPDECCGVLVGERDDAEPAALEAWAMNNEIERESRRSRFRISPKAYWRAEQRARRAGWTILGVYHSHPDLPAIPSRTDRLNAWPELLYVLWEIRRGLPLRMAAWRLAADRSRFVPAPYRTAGAWRVRRGGRYER